MILSDQLEDSDKKCLFQSDIDDYMNKIFVKEELIELICDNDYYINENTIRTYINENTIRTYINDLRRKLDTIDELEIVTVRGIGYKRVIKKVVI